VSYFKKYYQKNRYRILQRKKERYLNDKEYRMRVKRSATYSRVIENFLNALRRFKNGKGK
jgi:hypothetical protein